MGDLVDSIFVRSPARSAATVSPAGIGERDKVAPFGGIALPFYLRVRFVDILQLI